MAPIMAFMILAFVYSIGEFVGTRSKAWIPSVFVTATLLLLGFWTFFPADIVTIAGMGAPLGGAVGILFCITHMGTIISIQELTKQWKIILITLAGLAGMIAFTWFICIPLVGRAYVVSGLPPLTGGIVAALMMQQAAAEKGLLAASILAIAMYVMQGFAGYPLTAVMLKQEGRRLLKDFRNRPQSPAPSSAAQPLPSQPARSYRIFKEVPQQYNTNALILGKLALVGTLAFFIQQLTNGALNMAVAALLLSILLTELGFLDKDALNKAHSFGFLMFVLMIFVFSGLSKATPAMLSEIAGPLVIIIGVGIVGMVIFSYVAGKLLKVSPFMAVATSLTALYGFPPNFVLTNEAVNALAQTPEEKQYLLDHMLPQMIVGGFVTVTISSVIVAGIFVNLL